VLCGLQQREGVERSVDCVSTELCYVGCSRGKELSAECTVLALNCVMWAAAEGDIERSVYCVSAELCYVDCSRGKELSAVCTVLALNCVMAF